MIYQNDRVRIEVEPAEIPWLKLFARQNCKEMTDCDDKTRQTFWNLLDLIEREMRDYFKPDKINIASFANYVPQVHWHIMARFKEDSFFPEPMWGQKQRDGNPHYPDMDTFLKQLLIKLNKENN